MCWKWKIKVWIWWWKCSYGILRITKSKNEDWITISWDNCFLDEVNQTHSSMDSVHVFIAPPWIQTVSFSVKNVIYFFFVFFNGILSSNLNIFVTFRHICCFPCSSCVCIPLQFNFPILPVRVTIFELLEKNSCLKVNRAEN